MGIVFLAERGRRTIMEHERKNKLKSVEKRCHMVRFAIILAEYEKKTINTDRPRKCEK